MAVRPSVPEIITVNSESLQTSIRDLLPSQNGFGSELQASNVITPIIDLTSAAEGSGLAIELQTALAFGSQTAFDAFGTTTTLANSPGFYRIFGSIYCGTTSTSQEISFDLNDGSTTKKILGFSVLGQLLIDYTVWLAAGESIETTSPNNNFRFRGSVRQIADSDGNLINPNGYPL
jgi:hypothetical protein